MQNVFFLLQRVNAAAIFYSQIIAISWKRCIFDPFGSYSSAGYLLLMLTFYHVCYGSVVLTNGEKTETSPKLRGPMHAGRRVLGERDCAEFAALPRADCGSVRASSQFGQAKSCEAASVFWIFETGWLCVYCVFSDAAGLLHDFRSKPGSTAASVITVILLRRQ